MTILHLFFCYIKSASCINKENSTVLLCEILPICLTDKQEQVLMSAKEGNISSPGRGQDIPGIGGMRRCWESAFSHCSGMALEKGESTC